MKTHTHRITNADSPAQLPSSHELETRAVFVDTTGGPVVLVLPADETSPGLLELQRRAVEVFKVSLDTNPITLRPMGAQYINDAAPTEDHVLASSGTGGVIRSWIYVARGEPHQWLAE